MKTAKILTSLLLVVSSLVARGADAIPAMRVESSRTMKIAIINSDASNPANQSLHKAFAESLGFQISQRYHAPLPLKPVVVDANTAAAGLANGTYDMVAVFGNTPSVLRNQDFKALKAIPTTGNQKPVINLIVLEDDRTLASMIDEAFPQALGEKFFQIAFAGYRKTEVTRERTEWSVAVASIR